MWPEINQRVNYPIKAGLVKLIEAEDVDLEDEVTKFCLSNLTIQLAELGIHQVVESWNAHQIPGILQITKVGFGLHLCALAVT